MRLPGWMEGKRAEEIALNRDLWALVNEQFIQIFGMFVMHPY